VKLLGSETVNGITERYWLHTGERGEDVITVETSEDVQRVFEAVRHQSEQKYKDFHYVASIPQTVISEICKVNAERWGIKPRDVFRELIQNRTNRAQKTWRLLTQGREYRQLQAKAYR